MVISVRTKVSHSYRLRRQSCVSGVFFAALVYRRCCAVQEKHLTWYLTGQNIFGGFSKPTGPLLLGVHPLVSEERRQLVIIDVRRVKNEDRLTGLSMSCYLEMCPSSSRSVPVLMGLISIFLIIILRSCVCGRMHIHLIGRKRIHAVH
uniref:Uncharacterized protein n=1 Tax=Nothobranchius kuhntae TaxID=321403 RepID=A0A1A8I2M8_NOTKU